ncbi:class I SAM-dependent methyltransferase [Thermosipho atlanticus]|uniref:16S rRNA m(2)G 1207 methyltransferase n=1 Tax=Thermosipho atlanticus DSM 15807 TaxID=1123380 RepID=A0A1M5SRH4_9BACT|nr:class I SAM-dependent methyltransferase [Thermosipho atlanticus]SHH41095.1 16S rRNA m(2)G 1207 methyltransferase [Thermosipho atlanticus DSM 15807]
MFEHYYTENPTSQLRVKEVELKLSNGHIYKFKTPSGVYSFGKIDKASKILIEYTSIKTGKVLDIGCGYGLIGITLKKEYPEIELYMSDINKRAVEFAKINAKENNIEAIIKQGNLYDVWENFIFDHIISNPPIVAGKEVWMELITNAYTHLKKSGSLELVAYHNKGGRRIKEFMKEIFGNVEELCKKGGIRVYKSIRL